MGSFCEIQIFAESRIDAKKILSRLTEEVARLEKKYSRFRNDSFLTEINRSADRKHGIEIDTIDLDYNIDPTKTSNRLVKAAVGYVSGFGFRARYKPDLLPGVYAADNIAN